MSSFLSVNTPKGAEIAVDEATTLTSPITPTPNDAPQSQPSTSKTVTDPAATPTRENFQPSALPSQKPLPSSPFPDLVQIPTPAQTNTPSRGNSQRSRKSRDSEDIDMDQSDGEHGASSGESINPDGPGSSKKKKAQQKFYCRGYANCNLSFTRSEHLARHIRKHTGERPFSCHCGRRFSRLDNLRQHAQTVHQNEDLPADLQGRYQSAVRTGSVRQTGRRARAGTGGSVGQTGRGHSKSLSTSSIAAARVPAYGIPEPRRRPQAIVMPSEPSSRYSFESVRGPDGQILAPPSPRDFATPRSTNLLAEQDSPRWGPGPGPVTPHSRSHSLYSDTASRRQSFPSGVSALQLLGPTRHYPQELASPSSYHPSASSSQLPTPTTPTFSRRESTSSATDEAWRRRTWHPDTRHSFLNHVHTLSDLSPSPGPPRLANPMLQRQAQQQPQILPGIESFDRISQPRSSPPRRIPSPMVLDSDSTAPSSLLPAPEVVADTRRNIDTIPWDVGLHSGIRRLDLNNAPSDSAAAWSSETNQALLARSAQSQHDQVQSAQAPPVFRFAHGGTQGPMPGRAPLPRRHHYTLSAPSANFSHETRRHGWYGGPSPFHQGPETIPEGRQHVDRIAHPNMDGFQWPRTAGDAPIVGQQHAALPSQRRHPDSPALNGSRNYLGQDVSSVPRQPTVAFSEQPRDTALQRPIDTRGLDALVAVATSEASNASALERVGGKATDQEKRPGLFSSGNAKKKVQVVQTYPLHLRPREEEHLNGYIREAHEKI